MKRGYVEAKYKQNKALNSLNGEKQVATFLPFISNGWDDMPKILKPLASKEVVE
jgi:hypothetical protein